MTVLSFAMRQHRLTVLIAAFAVACPAHAAPGTPAPAPSTKPGAPPAARVLTVAMSGSYWPLHEETSDGGRDGFEAELARDLGRLLGLQVRFVGRKETGGGSIDAVASGKADVAIASITPTDERRKLVDFTKPYLVLHYLIATRQADSASPLETADKKMAVPRGPAAAVAKALHPRATIVEVSSPDAAAQAVLGGKADFAFGEDVGMVLAIRGRPLGLVGPPVGESPIAVAVPKGQAARYDEALAKLAGRIAELARKYRPGEVPEMPDDVYLNIPGGIDDVFVHFHRENVELSNESPDREERDKMEWRSMGGRGGEVQINVDAKVVGTPSAAILRRVEKDLHDAATATWLELPDGTLIGFDEKSENQQCGGTEMGPEGEPVEYSYDCPEIVYSIVAIRGNQQDSTSVTLMTGT